MFGKNKKHQELELSLEREREQQRQAEEKERQEKLKREIEEAEALAAEAMKNNTPYRFSTPDPMPKELVAVLKEMLKKLFPDAKKAYLVYTQYEEKAGYLLVVDIDARFHKIINLYLDSKTQKVRNGLPIDSILYSRSGALTEGMQPFYQKEGADLGAKPGAFSGLSSLDISSGFSFDDILGFESDIDSFDSKETDDESASEESGETEEALTDEENPKDDNLQHDEDFSADEAEQVEFKIEDEPVKVKPETKQQLFALMTRAGKLSAEEGHDVEIAGFGEFEFYIPYTLDDANAKPEQIVSECPNEAHLFHLINRDTGIKATVFFTDEENAVSFADSQGCGLAKMKYSDYKKSLSTGTILSPAAEGIIINPDGEQILLPPDYPLL